MILGLDVGGTYIKAGIVKAGRILHRGRFPTRARQDDASAVMQVTNVVARYARRVSAIGIGCAGIIDSERGIVRYSPNFTGWNNIELAPMLARRFRLPVRIINDVNAIMLGEWRYGAARGHDNAFLFTLGTGVGGAAVCEGRLLFGACGFAGEFGHTTIDYNGPRCVCGNRGCLERFVGSASIVKLARRMSAGSRSRLRDHPLLTPRIIAKEAVRGDAVARAVFERIGTYIGVGVSTVINLFDPEVVIISGGIARAGGVLYDPIKRAVKERILGPGFRDFKIVPAMLGDDAGILGASAWVCQARR